VSPSFDVRRLSPDDAAACRALRIRGLETDPRSFASSPEEERDVEGFRAYLRESDDDTFILGAFDGAALVGMVGVRREKHVKLRHKALVWGVYVAPEARRRGIGAALLAAVIAAARARPGVLAINLSADRENVAALALYEACGFRRYGVEERGLLVDGAWVDEVHMVLRL
jgi:RimJ/RimL family protein N-acetyltransferase